MKIAISGLGRMGGQIARKLSESNHTVIAHNRSVEPRKEAAKYGAIPAATKQEVIDSFDSQSAVIWMMLPDSAVDEALNEWLKIVPAGSTIIDGGNADFRLTAVRAGKVASAGSTLVDVGTSGGIWGYEKGFSMMVGGDETAVDKLVPVFEVLAAPDGGWKHFGPSGTGHYVKMVHNAIEYGMMESLAEGYEMLKDGPYKNIDLAAAATVWQKGSVVDSWLNELCRQALQENPLLKGIDGVVAESGETRWTLETAKQIGKDLPAIQAAFDVRIRSQHGFTSFGTKLLAAMRNKFGGHQINPQ